jgi:DNA-binding MarR family transcriptional regulator
MKSKENAFKPELMEQETGLLLWQVSRQWEKTIKDVLARQEFTYLEYILLSRLVELEKTEKQITQVKLAQYSGTEIMLTSKALRTLEEKGFIKRKKFVGDSRANLLGLSDKGAKRAEKIQKIVMETEDAFFASLEAKRSLFSKNLAKVFQSRLLQ